MASKYSAADWGPVAQLGMRAPGDYLDFDVNATAAPIGNLGSLSAVNVGGGSSSLGGLGGIGDWFNNSGFLGKTMANGDRMQGWGGAALGAASGIMNGWMGLQQLNLAKDTLAQNKKQFDLNYTAQKKTTNASLEDRQRARVASNSSAYQDVGSYMSKNGI